MSADDPEFQLTAHGGGMLVVAGATARTLQRHFHDEYGLGVMEAGAHVSASGRGQVEAQAGDVITVNAGEVHDGAAVGGQLRRWRMIYLQPGQVADLWADIGEGAGAAFEFGRPVASDPIAFVALRGLIRGVSAGMDPLAREEGLLRLLARLARETPGRPHIAAPSRVSRVKNAIDAAPDRSFTLAELAAIAGLSRYATLRAFSRTYGLTPRAYLQARRVNRARRLIMGGTPIAQAAAESGFCDQSHLNRTFRRHHGYAPGELRASCNRVQDRA